MSESPDNLDDSLTDLAKILVDEAEERLAAPSE
jgi:hypothetical protein